MADVDAATPTEKSSSHRRTWRKRVRPAADAESTLRKRQRSLAPAAANMNPSPSPPQSAKPRSPSPSKSQRLRSRDRRPVQQVAVAVEVEVEARSLHDLGMLNKPIEYVSDHSRLPPEMLPHWQALLRICRDLKTIPAAVAPRLADEVIHKGMIDHDDSRKKFGSWSVELEYGTLLEIHAAARRCADSGSDEAQWNTKVHDRILSCALRLFEPCCFEAINITSAKPIPDFAPLYKDDPSGPKVVDFSINIAPSRGSPLDSAIHTLLLHEPPQFLSINQTLNEAYKKPALISIATKKGLYEQEDARFKLGMWTAAWQNRVAAFRPREKLVCTPLPGLIVFGHTWRLYWVVDQDTAVDIIEFPIDIGDTRTVTGCYRLLTVIWYLLGTWMPDTFMPWLMEKVLRLKVEEE